MLKVRAQELIVEKDMLRKANEQAPIDVKILLFFIAEILSIFLSPPPKSKNARKCAKAVQNLNQKRSKTLKAFETLQMLQ